MNKTAYEAAQGTKPGIANLYDYKYDRQPGFGVPVGSLMGQSVMLGQKGPSGRIDKYFYTPATQRRENQLDLGIERMQKEGLGAGATRKEAAEFMRPWDERDVSVYDPSESKNFTASRNQENTKNPFLERSESMRSDDTYYDPQAEYDYYRDDETLQDTKYFTAYPDVSGYQENPQNPFLGRSESMGSDDTYYDPQAGYDDY